ncbi:MAG: CsiV family protein [Pseudohongiellaceae bacterium]
MKIHLFKRLAKYYLNCLFSFLISSYSFAQERWFQIELSIFSNENIEGRNAESWLPSDYELNYPKNMRKLSLLTDLFLSDHNLDDRLSVTESASQEEIDAMIRNDQLKSIRPRIKSTESNFKLFDFSRDDFTQLSSADSDFQQTNRTLERSSDHRLLYHGLWRQAVRQSSNAVPIYIEGGLRYGDNHELQGSITIRFNENEDRVVVDTHIWLIEYSIVKDSSSEWKLPLIPESIRRESRENSSSLTYFPNNVYVMEQSREMRSNEFHYLDHPALGLVISVKPYSVPSR